MPPEAVAMSGGVAPDFSLVQLAIYGILGMSGVLFIATILAVASLPLFFGTLYAMSLVLRGFQSAPDPVGKYAKLGGLVFRSLQRNLLRTALTYVALFVLTFVLTVIYSIISFLANVTREKEDNVQVIMTEKFSIPSTMPPGYVSQLKSIIRDDLPKSAQPNDIDKNFMTWSFVGGSLDPEKRTKENSLFFFCLEPDSILTMMNDQGLNKDDLGEDDYNKLVQAIELVKQDKRNIVIGEERLKLLGKQVGDTMKVHSTNYKDIVFEFNIVAAFPPSAGRYGQSAAMQQEYLRAKLDEYRSQKGEAHPIAERSVNLVWVRLPDKAAFEQLAAIVNNPKTFSSPAVKLETGSAGISSFLDAYKDILWGMKFLIMPAITAIMALVVGITITIGVRERWSEMAVLKVLGFLPWQIMAMIIIEAVLIGLFGSLLSSWLVTLAPRAIEFAKSNLGMQIKIAIFSNFKAPPEVLYLGPMLGVLVGLVGAALPSRAARNVKVSEVFAQVA